MTTTTTTSETIKPVISFNQTFTTETIISTSTKEIKVPQIDIKNQTITSIIETVDIIMPKIDLKNQTFNYT